MAAAVEISDAKAHLTEAAVPSLVFAERAMPTAVQVANQLLVHVRQTASRLVLHQL
jgi:hypothetical protein